jgi:hypothetical protein
MKPGYAQVPNDLAFDTRLSFGARATYPALRHLAWAAGRRKEGDPAELPSLDMIADKVGCSRTALKGYLKELRDSGWVHTARTARQRPQTYWILDAPDHDFVGQPSAPRNEVRSPESDLLSRARDSLSEVKDGRELTLSTSATSPPPNVLLVEKRNLGMDALSKVCSITALSPRYREVVIAINGKRGQPGIRELIWRGANDTARQAWRAHPEHFEEAVATMIRDRAALYVQKMSPGTILTPTALSKWWVDLPTMAASGGKRGLTPDEIASGAWREMV